MSRTTGLPGFMTSVTAFSSCSTVAMSNSPLRKIDPSGWVSRLPLLVERATGQARADGPDDVNSHECALGGLTKQSPIQAKGQGQIRLRARRAARGYGPNEA